MTSLPAPLTDEEKLARAERDRTRDARRQGLFEAMARGDVRSVRTMMAARHPQDGLITVNLLRAAAASPEPAFLDLLVDGVKAKTLGEAFKLSVREGHLPAVAAFARVGKPSACQHVLREAALLSNTPVFEVILAGCDPTHPQSAAFRAAARHKQWEHVRQLLPQSDPNTKSGAVLNCLLGPPQPAPEALVWAILERLTEPKAFQSALRAAGRSGRVDLMQWALERVEDVPVACTVSLMGAVMQNQGGAVDLLLARGADATATYAHLVGQAHQEPETWARLDFLGTRVALDIQSQWTLAHPGVLPQTAAAVRACRAGHVPATHPDRRRVRP